MKYDPAIWPFDDRVPGTTFYSVYFLTRVVLLGILVYSGPRHLQKDWEHIIFFFSIFNIFLPRVTNLCSNNSGRRLSPLLG